MVPSLDLKKLYILTDFRGNFHLCRKDMYDKVQNLVFLNVEAENVYYRDFFTNELIAIKDVSDESETFQSCIERFKIDRTVNYVSDDRVNLLWNVVESHLILEQYEKRVELLKKQYMELCGMPPIPNSFEDYKKITK